MTKLRTLKCLRCKGTGNILREQSFSSHMQCPACNGEGICKYVEVDKKLYRVVEAET